MATDVLSLRVQEQPDLIHVSPTTEEESIRLSQVIKAMQEVGVRLYVEAAYPRSSTEGYVLGRASKMLMRVSSAK
jgi:hypothetical protein